MKIFYDEISPEMISTFTPGEGWYTFKSKSDMTGTLNAEYGDALELIELTPDLYNKMLEAGDFDGYDPAQPRRDRALFIVLGSAFAYLPEKQGACDRNSRH